MKKLLLSSMILLSLNSFSQTKTSFLKKMVDKAPKNSWGTKQIDYIDPTNPDNHYWLNYLEGEGYVLFHFNVQAETDSTVFIQSSQLSKKGKNLVVAPNSSDELLKKALALPHKDFWRVKQW